MSIIVHNFDDAPSCLSMFDVFDVLDVFYVVFQCFSVNLCVTVIADRTRVPTKGP